MLSITQPVNTAMTRFKHLVGTKPTHSTELNMPPTYGTKVQHTPIDEPSDLLHAKCIKLIQDVAGTFCIAPEQ